MPCTLPTAEHPARRVAGCAPEWSTKNVKRLWRQDGLLMPQRRRRKRLASSSESETDRFSGGVVAYANVFQLVSMG